MAKKRKTLKEKKLTDQRLQPSHTESITSSNSEEEQASSLSHPSYQYTFSAKAKAKQPIQTTTIHTQQYTYLSKDLLRTAIVTCSIIVLELVFAFGIKN